MGSTLPEGTEVLQLFADRKSAAVFNNSYFIGKVDGWDGAFRTGQGSGGVGMGPCDFFKVTLKLIKEIIE